jgi:hypothetical protein
VLFCVACSSQNIDSLVNSKPKTNDELINIARELIYKEVIGETPNINNIRAYQNYLNEYKKYGLEDDENLMLYYFIQDWDNVFDQIHLYHSRSITGRGHNTVRNLSYTIFIEIDRNNSLDALKMSSLTKEQKDFLALYFSLMALWNVYDDDEIIISKSKDMVQEYNNNHPDSYYNKYLQIPLRGVRWFVRTAS